MRMSDLIEACEDDLEEGADLEEGGKRERDAYYAQRRKSYTDGPAKSIHNQTRCPDGFERDESGKCVKRGMAKSFVHKMKSMFGKK